MTNNRRDKKGRKLLVGESQRSDGRYAYRYTDQKGVRRTVYSWRLVETDKMPKDKAFTPALRTMKNSIEQDLRDGIDTYAANSVTMNTIFDTYMKQRLNIKDSTYNLYYDLYNKYVRNDIGAIPICNINYLVLKDFYIKMLQINPTYTFISKFTSVTQPLFEIALKSGYIARDPSIGILKEMKCYADCTTKKKEPLTHEEEARFMKFVNDDTSRSKNKAIFVTLLKTGMRESELCGLTWDDCDFFNNVIHVTKILKHGKLRDGTSKTYIDTPKTHNGVRDIPMLPEVKEVLIELYNNRPRDVKCAPPVIDGVTNFIFLNRFGRVLTPHEIYLLTVRTVDRYNRLEEICARNDEREPAIFKNVTPHTFRHTFCTRLCESKINIKVIQQIMGHADACMTLNIYTQIENQVQNNEIEKFIAYQNKLSTC